MDVALEVGGCDGTDFVHLPRIEHFTVLRERNAKGSATGCDVELGVDPSVHGTGHVAFVHQILDGTVIAVNLESDALPAEDGGKPFVLFFVGDAAAWRGGQPEKGLLVPLDGGCRLRTVVS